MKWLISAVLLASLVFAAPASAQFYKYLDKQGNIRFTDDINQVPENQRNKARSYVVSEPDAPAAHAPEGGAEKLTAGPDASDAASADAAVASSVEEEPVDTAKTRLEEMKKQVDGDYQALAKEKEALGKEKDLPKGREQVVEYNKRVEAFNKKAGEFEARSNELRKQVEVYNARVIEENAKMSQSAKK